MALLRTVLTLASFLDHHQHLSRKARRMGAERFAVGATASRLRRRRLAAGAEFAGAEAGLLPEGGGEAELVRVADLLCDDLDGVSCLDEEAFGGFDPDADDHLAGREAFAVGDLRGRPARSLYFNGSVAELTATLNEDPVIHHEKSSRQARDPLIRLWCVAEADLAIDASAKLCRVAIFQDEGLHAMWRVIGDDRTFRPLKHNSILRH